MQVSLGNSWNCWFYLTKPPTSHVFQSWTMCAFRWWLDLSVYLGLVSRLIITMNVSFFFKIKVENSSFLWSKFCQIVFLFFLLSFKFPSSESNTANFPIFLEIPCFEDFFSVNRECGPLCDYWSVNLQWVANNQIQGMM